MSRPLRINLPGLTYHVVSRGNGRMPIFLDDHDRRTFLARLADMVNDCQVTCHAYCLMGNHYHLLVTTRQPNLSRAVQRLNGRYAQWWNVRHARVGHMFQGRFRGQVIQDDAYLLAACRYIVLNPVRARLVARPDEWPWSSYRVTAGLRRLPDFVTTDMVWGSLARSGREAIQMYRRFVSDPIGSGDALPKALVVGDETFARRFERLRQKAGPEAPPDHRSPLQPVATFFTAAPTRKTRDASAAAAYIGGHAMAQIARHLDVHPSAVSRMIRRHKRGSERAECAKSRSDPRHRVRA